MRPSYIQVAQFLKINGKSVTHIGHVAGEGTRASGNFVKRKHTHEIPGALTETLRQTDIT